MLIKQNTVVSMHYKLSDTEGKTLDESSDDQPLVYLQGASNIIVGLEEELEGKQAGDNLNVTVSPEKAYGMPVEALIQEVPKAAFGEIDQIEVGMRFQADTEQGPVPVIVTQMTEDTVTVDGNHPLAGQVLNFDVTVVEVREATQEEIDHGHVHAGHAH